MKLVLDWDEDTVDLVRIAVASLMLSIGTAVPAEVEISILRKILDDLAPQDDEEGIYLVKELLGSHEARLPKEET
jgi:hypothetical protein